MLEIADQTSAPLSRHVRERARRHDQAEEINVSQIERLASLAGGAGLVLYGISRGSIGGLGLALLGGALVYRGASGHCAAYKAMGVNTARHCGPRASLAAKQGVKVEESVTVLRPRAELYRYWRNFSNLPRIMHHLHSVQSTGDGRSHWVAKGPFGTEVEWDAEIITERENELISWRSVGDSDVDTAGSVHFSTEAGGHGTKVHVVLKYDPPAGKLGVTVAQLLGESPAEQIREDLRRFKQFMEAGAAGATEEQPTDTRT